MSISVPGLDNLQNVGLLIGDRVVKDTSAGVREHRYAATGSTTGSVPVAGSAEVDTAVRTAREAFTTWRNQTVDTRRNLMLKLADLVDRDAARLGELSVLDNGTPIGFAGSFGPIFADLLRYNAGWADKIQGDLIPVWPFNAHNYTRPEPYGVVAVIIPWNGSIVGGGMILGPALAAGNCVVLKPPELTPYAIARLGELTLEAGFPPGVINIITGDGGTGDALVRHPGVDKIHFTGSGPTARIILKSASENLTPVVMELGGKSANLVFADAPDLDAAAQHALGQATALSGQACIAGSRIIVEDAIYDEFINRMTTLAQSVEIGDPMSTSTVMGPVISEAASEKILGFVERTEKDHAGRLVYGGRRIGGELKDGYFIPPTIFADVDARSELAQHEVFGPVLAVMRFKTEDEAVRLANDTEYGLAAWLQTGDAARVHRVSSQLDVGSVWVNGGHAPLSMMPFGGVKQSGYGRLGGYAGIQEFTRIKNVWVELS